MQIIIDEGWSYVFLQFINKKVDTMPDQIQAVLDGGEAMTRY